MDEVDEQEKADLDLYPSDFDESDNDEYGFEEFERKMKAVRVLWQLKLGMVERSLWTWPGSARGKCRP